MSSETLPESWLKKRARLRETIHGDKSILYHVRGMVDGYVVWRYWAKHKQRWVYECKSQAQIQVMRSFGTLELVKEGD